MGKKGLMTGIVPWLWPSLATAQERASEWGSGHASDVGDVGSVGHRDDGDDARLLWGVVIAGIVLGIRWLVSQGKEARPTDVALDILRQRCARGDISKEEFEAKKRDLA